ncbi:MAG: hypothetical protein ACYTDW_21310 [Planctomycetota bacterium]
MEDLPPSLARRIAGDLDDRPRVFGAANEFYFAAGTFERSTAADRFSSKGRLTTGRAWGRLTRRRLAWSRSGSTTFGLYEIHVTQPHLLLEESATLPREPDQGHVVADGDGLEGALAPVAHVDLLPHTKS